MAGYICLRHLAMEFWRLFAGLVSFFCLVKTDSAVQHALAIQKAYPKAFSMRMAERSWCPSFLRECGALLLIFAGAFSFKSAVELFSRMRQLMRNRLTITIQPCPSGLRPQFSTPRLGGVRWQSPWSIDPLL